VAGECKPRDVLLWRRLSACPAQGRRSGDFLPKRVKAGDSEELRLLCVSFECDSLSGELWERKEKERGTQFRKFLEEVVPSF
jgi:hypothetical protein